MYTTRPTLRSTAGSVLAEGDSQYHSIMAKRLIDWKDRWNLLGIFPSAD